MYLRLIAVGLAATALTACATYDNDDNPPGPVGGWGTNWENPPGPAGGPGTSPDRYYSYNGQRYAFAPRDGGYYYNNDFGYYHPGYGWLDSSGRCWRERNWNPPGPAGGPGGWPTPPGSPGSYRRC